MNTQLKLFAYHNLTGKYCHKNTYNQAGANEIITGYVVTPPSVLHHRHLLVHLVSGHHELFQVFEEIFIGHMVLKFFIRL